MYQQTNLDHNTSLIQNQMIPQEPHMMAPVQNVQMSPIQNTNLYAPIPGTEPMVYQTNINVSDIQHQMTLMQQQLMNQQLCIDQLRAENAALLVRLENENQFKPKSVSYSPPDWEEEERIVTEETNKGTSWIVKENQKKKRKRSESVSPTKKFTQAQPKQVKKLTDKPPPIIVEVEGGTTPIIDLLENLRIQFNSNRMNDHQLKINVLSGDDYRIATATLQDNNYQFHTYENKQDRPIKVMARNIHQTCTEEEIFHDLRHQGLNIQLVNQKLKLTRTENGIVKKPLTLYTLTFASNENVKKIHEIKYICHMKVSIENLRKNKLIPQCKKCQQYGHTQNFCRNHFKCVKCGGAHETVRCTKERTAPPKCCNCGEAHPANYRFCCVAKKLQELRDKKNNNTNKNKNNNDTTSSNLIEVPEKNVTTNNNKSQRVNNLSYAQVVNNTNSNRKPSGNENISEMLLLLLGKMNKMEQELSAFKNQHPKTTKKSNNSNQNGRK